jgi:hypothetical protein
MRTWNDGNDPPSFELFPMAEFRKLMYPAPHR